jgi:hypothetical protein
MCYIVMLSLCRQCICAGCGGCASVPAAADAGLDGEDRHLSCGYVLVWTDGQVGPPPARG